jgi:hypothetical protein
MKSKENYRQLNIFEWFKQAQDLIGQQTAPANGSLDIDSELRAAVSADIKACPFSRYQIAARMSELTGQEITESMLYSWTADSKDRHRFPCQFLPAFAIATGQRRTFEVLSRHSGLFALPGPEALRAEIQRLDEEIKTKQGEKQKRLFFLKEIEGVKK